MTSLDDTESSGAGRPSPAVLATVRTGLSEKSVETTCTWLSRSDSPWLLVTHVRVSSSMSTCALRMMRLASIILATVRPDAAAEPKVDETVHADEIEAHVSEVKAA